jgi:glycosyltransferase involved in cell wall biosynthesis
LKIAIVSLNMLEGWSGVERMSATLGAAMMERGHAVTVVARIPRSRKGDEGPLTRLPPEVKLLKLNLMDACALSRARDEIKAQAFDAAIGMFGNREWLWFPWLFAGSGVPLIAAEGQPPDVHLNKFDRIWQPYEYFGVMAGMDAVQVLLEPFIDCYPEPIRERVTVIGNPIGGSPGEAGRQRSPVLLGVGRFDEPHKRFSLLIRAFEILSKDYPEWKLKLVGDGPYWDYYRALASRLGLKKRVVFTGSVADMGEHYAQAELLCLPSRYEGFGLVLAEAASYELPLAGFSSCVAARTLIAPGGGALAEEDTPASLADALRPMMAMSSLQRRAMGQRAQAFFTEKYAPGKVFGAWDGLLESTVTAARKNGQTQLGRILRRDAESPGDRAGGGEDDTIQSLESGISALREDYYGLSKKYAGLLHRFQSMAGRGRGR